MPICKGFTHCTLTQFGIRQDTENLQQSHDPTHFIYNNTYI